MLPDLEESRENEVVPVLGTGKIRKVLHRNSCEIGFRINAVDFELVPHGYWRKGKAGGGADGHA